MAPIHTKNGVITAHFGGSGFSAYSHGDCLGLNYKTVAGARCAITRYHKKWLKQTDGGKNVLNFKG